MARFELGQFMPMCWEEDSDVEYVRGHVDLATVRQAVERYEGTGSTDLAARVKGIKHRWARCVPQGAHSDYSWLLHVYDEQKRGSFAVTELDVSR